MIKLIIILTLIALLLIGIALFLIFTRITYKQQNTKIKEYNYKDNNIKRQSKYRF